MRTQFLRRRRLSEAVAHEAPRALQNIPSDWSLRPLTLPAEADLREGQQHSSRRGGQLPEFVWTIQVTGRLGGTDTWRKAPPRESTVRELLRPAGARLLPVLRSRRGVFLERADGGPHRDLRARHD